MTTYISGGSNSLLGNGWTHYFYGLREEPVDNLAIGASPSMMAAYRAMFTVDLEPGDTLIWEYAINDVDYVDTGFYHSDYLLGFVEHIIIHCQRLGVFMAPVIFKPLREEKRVVPSRHYRKLKQLFAHHGVEAYDFSEAYRAELGVDTLPPSFYEDGYHYTRTPEAMGFIAAGVSDAVDLKRIPIQTSPIYAESDGLKFYNGFCDARFTNEILDLPVASMPFEIEMEPDEALAAILIITSPLGGAFSVETETATANFSAVYKQLAQMKGQAKFTRPLLKVFGCERSVQRKWFINPDDPVKFSWADGSGPFYADQGMKPTLDDEESEGRKALIVGVMTETGVYANRLGV